MRLHRLMHGPRDALALVGPGQPVTYLALKIRRVAGAIGRRIYAKHILVFSAAVICELKAPARGDLIGARAKALRVRNMSAAAVHCGRAMMIEVDFCCAIISCGVGVLN